LLSPYTARAAAEAETRKLDLARNEAKYMALRAQKGGVVTGVRVESARSLRPYRTATEPGRVPDHLLPGGS
jgi:hypothetical protein